MKYTLIGFFLFCCSDTVKKIWNSLPLERELPGEEAQEALILGQASSVSSIFFATMVLLLLTDPLIPGLSEMQRPLAMAFYPSGRPARQNWRFGTR